MVFPSVQSVDSILSSSFFGGILFSIEFLSQSTIYNSFGVIKYFSKFYS